ncbi:MAG: hypothetical protein COS47_01730 [Candidatus Nealsonbacteria bacterium CG03_land_8_20_14_0_80_36_12]|uniref:Transcriptional repressor PaaX-like central Cas2-like domain-containing protein n=1 Tax=Candidatus Nealsonbacteria bacterium CG03_land_8_20_14_0_80_36_12 TaxID=1974701 RepID=A0A2M7BY42_9BACT|nr:MAG: hypothetical protein COS47_01730 [Candidatus Nealsonbacteria bacterium CG03_land_8_20_14_0_80_36_12]
MGLNKNSIKNAGEIIVERVVDLVLVAIFFNLESPFLVRTKNRYQISDVVVEDLEKFNYQSIKRAFLYLKRKGLISVLNDADYLPKVSKLGEKKLRQIIPFYDDKRIWDKRIYLIFYDIPVSESRERNYLRSYLKKIGCGLLQKSVWITPYNPTLLIRSFVGKHGLSSESILVSSIGEKGTVGEMSLNYLLNKVYHLDSLNLKYQEFIEAVEKKSFSKSQLAFWFLSILKADPQIPFCLLPAYWKGKEAYNIFIKLK